MRVRELAEWLGATFEGDGEKELTGVAPVETAGGADVAFVGSRKAAQQAEASAAGCLIVPVEWPSPCYRTVIRAPEPRTAFARAMNRFYPTAELKPGIGDYRLGELCLFFGRVAAWRRIQHSNGGTVLKREREQWCREDILTQYHAPGRVVQRATGRTLAVVGGIAV